MGLLPRTDFSGRYDAVIGKGGGGEWRWFSAAAEKGVVEA